MPNCFTLTRKSTPQEGATALAVIDDEMRLHFGAPLDSHNYYCYWSDVIGLALACGKSLKELIARYQYDWMGGVDYAWGLCLIAQWLEENFTVSAWVEIGGRK